VSGLRRVRQGRWQLRGQNVTFVRMGNGEWTVGPLPLGGGYDRATRSWLCEISLAGSDEPVSFATLKEAVRCVEAAIALHPPPDPSQPREVKLLRRNGSYVTEDGRWTVGRGQRGEQPCWCRARTCWSPATRCSPG